MIHPGIDKVIALLREAGEERFSMMFPCGTPCCIGGHCRIATGNDKASIVESVMIVAGIPFSAAIDLCYPSETCEGLNWKYSKITLTDAISVLAHYRDTGIVDWSPVSKRLEREAV